MTQSVGTLDGPAELATLRSKAGWIVALGVVYIIVGMMALGSVVTATVVSVYFVGLMMIIAGVGEIINAFQLKNWSRVLLWALVGLLYVVAGFIALSNPLLTAVMLTLILGLTLAASGIIKLILAISVKQDRSWIWVALSALVTLALGLIILARWPVSSVYILGIFLGVDLVVTGAGWIGLGMGVRHAKA